MVRICLMLLTLCLLTSCAQGLYIGRLAWGETKILWGSVPIQEILRGEGVTAEVKERLRLVQDVKEFARERFGLRPGGCYESFFNVKGDTLLYLVSACPKDSLEPYTWSFPIVGEVSYKGFFKKRHALREKARLEEMGFDTCLQGVAAFSTLGWLHDPIYSTIVDQHPVILINITIHELVHNTIFFKGETDFNEQIASFIGEEGTLTFIEERFGRSSPYYRLAIDLAGDEERIAGVFQGLYGELEVLYSQDLPWEETMRRREEIFAHGRQGFTMLRSKLKTGYFMHLGEEQLNNASIVFYRHYLSPPDNLLQQVYEVLGSDLRGFVELLKGLKKTKEPPYRSLERWLQERAHFSCG